MVFSIFGGIHFCNKQASLGWWHLWKIHSTSEHIPPYYLSSSTLCSGFVWLEFLDVTKYFCHVHVLTFFKIENWILLDILKEPFHSNLVKRIINGCQNRSFISFSLLFIRCHSPIQAVHFAVPWPDNRSSWIGLLLIELHVRVWKLRERDALIFLLFFFIIISTFNDSIPINADLL